MKLTGFLKQVRQELHRITWLSSKDTLISVGVVVAVSIIFSLIFTLFDFVILSVSQFVLKLGI